MDEITRSKLKNKDEILKEEIKKLYDYVFDSFTYNYKVIKTMSEEIALTSNGISKMLEALRKNKEL